MARVKSEDQPQLFDRVLEDPEFEEAISRMLDAAPAAKAHRKAKASVDIRVKDLKLKADERVRVGEFVITGFERNGGGFNVAAWTSVTDKISRNGS